MRPGRRALLPRSRGDRCRGGIDGRHPCPPSRRTTPAAALARGAAQDPRRRASSPTDADWQQVGELTLEPTKANSPRASARASAHLHGTQQPEPAQQPVPWLPAAVGGRTRAPRSSWIDLAQADYNARLQQSIATGTVDFDILEMGAPFEGDTAGRGLLDPMPDWVAEQIDMDDYVDYLKAPIGTWDGKTYRISIDGDTHTLAYRTDYYANEDAHGGLGRGRSRRRVGAAHHLGAGQRAVEVPGRQDRPADGPATPTASSTRSSTSGAASASTSWPTAPRRTPSIPTSPAWLFDPETMKPRVNNPGWVQAIQDVIDLDGHGRRLSARPDQRRPQHDRLPAVPGRAPARRSCGGATWARSPATSDTLGRRRCRGLRHQPRRDPRLQLADRRMGGDARTSPRTTPTSAGACTSPTGSRTTS